LSASSDRAVALTAVVIAACGGSRATPRPAAAVRSEAEGALALQMINPEEITWPPQEPDTPPTMRIAVIEGVFPFGPQKAYTALIEFDPGVAVPAHSHPTTERVTVLAGAVDFGTGREVDRSKSTALTPGAVIITPAGTPHWGFIPGAKALLFIHGVGPHNDPRAVDPAAAAPGAARFDPPLAGPVIRNPAEVRFAPASDGLPPGSSIAVVEGDPLHSPAEFILRVRLPAGARIARHRHATHERIVVLSGRLTVSADRAAKEMRPGGVVLMPAGIDHTLATASGADLQIQGVGPFRVDGARTRPATASAASSTATTSPAPAAARRGPCRARDGESLLRRIARLDLARYRLPEADDDAGAEQRDEEARDEAVIARIVAGNHSSEESADHRTDDADDDVGESALSAIGAHDLAADPSGERADDDPEDDAVRWVHAVLLWPK
jgi:quercetin dioxygenase-like cupin family protein